MSFFLSVAKQSLPMWIALLSLLPQIHGSEQPQKRHLSDKAFSFHVDYKETSSPLCLIGAHYDTDKSSQRMNVSGGRHCHPYTLFYHSVFRSKQNAPLTIAELGILDGASLLMWKDYFPQATLYGFDVSLGLINQFKLKYGNDRTHLGMLDVKDLSSIVEAFRSTGVQFDLIIDDTTHQFEDQLKVIEAVHPYLKPGGMLIIEDIFLAYNEQDYIDRLKPILDQFQDYYFISMDHKNRCSTGSDNDKLFVLVKEGGPPILRNEKKITVITPCCRPQNLIKVKDSIDFNYVDEWIIVYDGKTIYNHPNIFQNEGNPKIKEYLYRSKGSAGDKSRGISGNPQRNYALDHVQNEDTYLYFLDDDNLIHKDLYRLLDIADEGKLYTFDQENRLKGDSIVLSKVDSGSVLIDFKLCKTLRWIPSEYAADFYYIAECYSKNTDKWIYVNNVLATHNILLK